MSAVAEGLATQDAAPRDLRRFCIILGVALLIVLAGCELVVRLGLSRISRIEQRTEMDHRAVLALRHSTDPAPKVLVIGSSLLLYAVDFPALQRSLGPEFHAVRYCIEQTAYFDWYYGMRSLYAEGVRPDAVVFLMSASYTASNDLRGDYFAYRMMQTRDVRNVAKDLNLSPTATFGLFLSRYSAFYGTRSETRKIVLAKLLPAVKDLRPMMIPAPPPRASHEAIVRIAASRLAAFNSMVREHGGRLIFVEAPSLASEDAGEAQEAGGLAGVPVLVPLRTEVLSNRDFLDGAHLNESGAARYTAALTPLLRDTLRDRLRMAAGRGGDASK